MNIYSWAMTVAACLTSSVPPKISSAGVVSRESVPVISVEPDPFADPCL